MINPISAMRSAIRAVLISDDELLNILGGSQIFVVAPAGATPPYITFGEARVEDWSSVELKGHQHRFFIDVWSREGGDTEALAISNRLFEVLLSGPPSLDGHNLIGLEIINQTIDPPSNNGFTNVRIQIEAFTETINPNL